MVDCANGAAYNIAPLVFSELGANVVAVANEPDGFNINFECGSTHPAMLQQAVRYHAADLGVALDGDGDRAILVDETGEIVDGDQLLYIVALARQRVGTLRGGVAGTLMSNLGLEQALAERGIPFVRAAVGDRYVLGALAEQGWELGGETSGHILCLDKSSTGDGIIAALQVLAASKESGKTLGQLKAGMTICPQRLINVRMKRRFDVQASAQVAGAVAEAERELGSQGRVVLRASGTEPVVRVMVEGRDAGQVERLAQSLAHSVQRAAEEAA